MIASKRRLSAADSAGASADVEKIEPLVDGRRVIYAGEVAGLTKQRLYARACALLMPIRWREPFGMVMVEALACGTPVIAFPEGAAAEIVIDGDNGMLVADERQMAQAIDDLGSIDPQRCRASVAERYDVTIAVGHYERIYRRALASRAARTTRRTHRRARRRPNHPSPPISRRA